MTHAFLSYCRDNSPAVMRLNDDLRSRGIRTWVDIKDIRAGANWRTAIHSAIKDGAAFVACFSKEFEVRNRTYAHNEVRLAIQQLQEYPAARAWFIPVKLNECEIPDLSIGGTDRLSDLNYVNLGRAWDNGVDRIFAAIKDHCGLTEQELSKTSVRGVMKRIWAGLYPLKCAGDDLLNDVSEANLAAFTTAFQHLKELMGKELIDLSDGEFNKLDEIVKFFGKYRLGKRRLLELRQSDHPAPWQLQEMQFQIRHNIAAHKQFSVKLQALRTLYDTGKQRLAA